MIRIWRSQAFLSAPNTHTIRRTRTLHTIWELRICSQYDNSDFAHNLITLCSQSVELRLCIHLSTQTPSTIWELRLQAQSENSDSKPNLRTQTPSTIWELRLQAQSENSDSAYNLITQTLLTIRRTRTLHTIWEFGFFFLKIWDFYFRAQNPKKYTFTFYWNRNIIKHYFDLILYIFYLARRLIVIFWISWGHSYRT